jgi:hypothetical protein
VQRFAVVSLARFGARDVIRIGLGLLCVFGLMLLPACHEDPYDELADDGGEVEIVEEDTANLPGE